jgi:hypothetical protein
MNTTETQIEQKFKTYVEVEKAFNEKGPLAVFTANIRGYVEVVRVLSIKPVIESYLFSEDDACEVIKVEIEHCSSFNVSSRFYTSEVEISKIVSIDPVLAPSSFEMMINLLEHKIEPVQTEFNKLNNALIRAKASLEEKVEEREIERLKYV